MNKEEVLAKHEEIITKQKELEETHKNLFKEYFTNLGIKRGVVFTLNSSYSGVHKCVAMDSIHYRYLTKNGKISNREDFRTLWAGDVTNEITIEKELNDEEIQALWN